MTEEEYMAGVRRLGLRPTNVPWVYSTETFDVYNVPDPSKYTFDQRPEVLTQLKRRMGISD